MPQEKSNTHTSQYLWLSMLISVIFPMLLGFILSRYLTDWKWVHYPFHAMVESVGSFSALIIATLIIIMVKNKNLPQYYIWVASALIGMGILDGFHAVLHSGISFVWLHSVATLIGGLTFAAIWCPKSWFSTKHHNALILLFITISSVISLFSIYFPENLPTMIVQGEFSTLAKFLNITGGIGFLAGSAYFVYLHYKDASSKKQRQKEDLVFANHCLLFGIAGLLFESSVIWDAGWWWWHILRLTAYFVALIYFFSIFKKQQDLLTLNKLDLEKRVYERTKELEKASNAKSEFLTSMSHELRTPLNAILGFGQLLSLDQELEYKQKKSVDEIVEAGHHLLYLINEVLDLSRVEDGELELDLKDVNIAKIITECLTTLAPIAAQNNIELINSITHEESYFVVGDTLRLKQVVINLLSNAIKYNKEDGKVFIYFDDTDKNKIRVSFKDTGPGIAKELQHKLFVPFERLNQKNSAIDGVGIGLVLSKKLIENMQGSIGMHSTAGHGCTFYIELPKSA